MGANTTISITIQNTDLNITANQDNVNISLPTEPPTTTSTTATTYTTTTTTTIYSPTSTTAISGSIRCTTNVLSTTPGVTAITQLSNGNIEIQFLYAVVTLVGVLALTVVLLIIMVLCLYRVKQRKSYRVNKSVDGIKSPRCISASTANLLPRHSVDSGLQLSDIRPNGEPNSAFNSPSRSDTPESPRSNETDGEDTIVPPVPPRDPPSQFHIIRIPNDSSSPRSSYLGSHDNLLVKHTMV